MMGAVYASQLALLVALVGRPGLTAAEVQAIATPAPVSGRSLERPESISASDVLARLNLVRDNLELIRIHMGRHPAPAPLIRATRAWVTDAYYEGINLRRRLSRLAYEELRVDVKWRILRWGEMRPFDVFGLIDGGLAIVLGIKQSLGIEQSVAERVQPEETTPTELFNAVVETGALINVLLDKKTQERQSYLGATVVVSRAAQLHVLLTNRFMPNELDLVPNRMPHDVLNEVSECFELVSRLARSYDIEPLGITIMAPSAGRPVYPDDIVNLFVLMVAELDRVAEKAGLERVERRLVPPDRKFPSDVYQRTRLLKAILHDLVEVREAQRS